MLSNKAENFLVVSSKFPDEDSEGFDRLVHLPCVEVLLFLHFLRLVDCQVQISLSIVFMCLDDSLSQCFIQNEGINRLKMNEKKKVLTVEKHEKGNRALFFNQVESYQFTVLRLDSCRRRFHLGKEFSVWLLMDKEMFKCSIRFRAHQNFNIIDQ